MGLLERVNYVKQLVNSRKNEFTFETLDEMLDSFRVMIDKMPITDKKRYVYYLQTCKAYDKLTNLLYRSDGKIKEEEHLQIRDEVSTKADEVFPDNDNYYYAYFNCLATIENDKPLTEELLDSRIAFMSGIDEFTLEADPVVKKKKEDALYLAYSTLKNLVEQRGGKIDDTRKLVQIAGKNFYGNKDYRDELSPEELELDEALVEAQKKALDERLPMMLARSKNGLITEEIVENSYNIFKEMNIFGNNMDFESRLKIEKIYSAMQLALAEKDGVVTYESKKALLDRCKDKLPEGESDAIIYMLLEGDGNVSGEEVKENLKQLVEITADPSDTIAEREKILKLKFAFCVIMDKIQENNGSCSLEELRKAYSTAIDRLEEYKKIFRGENKSPFKLYSDDLEKNESEYIAYLDATDEKIIEEAEDIDKITQRMAILGVYKELYEVISDPDKRRELTEIKFNPDQSSSYTDIGIDRLNYSMLKKFSDVKVIENNVGDEIAVRRVGTMGFEAMGVYGDGLIDEWLVTKTYHSRAKEGESPEIKEYRVFSRGLNGAFDDPEIRDAYANQVFSDISLETAVEKNGGLIGEPRKIKKPDGTYEVVVEFDANRVCACIKLAELVEEAESARSKTRKRVIERSKHAILEEYADIPVEKGYATERIIVPEDKSIRPFLGAFKYESREYGTRAGSGNKNGARRGHRGNAERE